MWRQLSVEVGVSVDSSFTSPLFGPAKVVCYQQKDNQEFHTRATVAPGATETAIAIAPVTQGYFFCLFSDYPVLVRLNGPSATQFTLNTNNVAATNVGSPLPNQCCLILTGQVSSVRLAPIASAQQTANVTIVVTGDPTNAYT